MMKPDTIQNRGGRRGFTLIEVLVGVVILGVILAMAVPSMSDFLERRRVIAAANEVADVINFARSQPNVIGDRVTLHLEKDESEKTSCIAVVTESGSDNCVCYETPICTTPASVVLRAFQLPNDHGVAFEANATSWGSNLDHTLKLTRQQVTMDATGVEITVTGRRSGAQLRLEMNNLGRVRLCSPNSSINGYGTCANPVQPAP